MTPRTRRRVWWSLAASFAIHLLLLWAYQRMADWHRRQELRPTRYLPDLLLAPQLFRREAIPRMPEREMEQAQAAEVAPIPLPDIASGAPRPLPALEGPTPALDSMVVVLGDRPPVFYPQPELGELDLNELQIEAVRQLREQYDRYARHWTPDVDTTDAESVARAKAEAVVARAFEAMGGLDRLLKITEMRQVVWIEANEHLLPEVGIVSEPPYAYPIAVWRFHGLDKVARSAFRIEIDLSSGRPVPSYLTKNPALTRRSYYLNFDARWFLSAPPTTRELRIKSEEARWHIVDRFLGEGVRLSYLEAGRLDPAGAGLSAPVHRIQVDDRKYGRLLEAMFHRETGLLVATREELTADEARWYRQKNNARPPVWVTQYDRYEPVGDVLLPHRWRRRGRRSVTVHFNIAVNAGLLTWAACL